MFCLICGEFSLSHICSTCQELYLRPSLHKRTLENGIQVLSFYNYNEIKELLFTKHTDLGYYIYTILAKNAFYHFSQNFHYPNTVASIAVDDNPKNNYSHTAILNKQLKSKVITPHYNILRASNPTTYSGKSREYRYKNSRSFTFKEFKEKDIILVDDIITTGSTLLQASTIAKLYSKEVLFCLTLADARD
jgi:competence protein ComFC